MTRKLLALSWVMLPLVFPRSLQISRALRVLAARGWKTTVVTVTPEAEPHATQDPQLQAFYQDACELRHIDPRQDARPLWRRILGMRRPGPTPNENWLLAATAALRREVRASRPDALISFAQPWIDHVVALQVKRRHPDLPWIAHFSDPWVDSPYFKPATHGDRQKAMEQERSIIERADAVVFTTPETAALVMAKYPPEWATKVHVVTHGFDADLLDLLPPATANEKFTITHTGNLYEGREPAALIRALAALRAEQPPLSVQVKLVGFATQPFRDAVAQAGLEDMVTLVPSRPFLESLSMARAADLLLVVDAPAQHSVFLPSKISDYLSLGKPILALTPASGASARVLGGLGYPVVDPEDEAGILAALQGALARWRQGASATPIPSSERLAAFDIRQVASDLEQVINGAIASRGRVHG